MDKRQQQQLQKYRQKHFAVEVKPSHMPEHNGELSLSVTHNGRQWQSIGLLPDEALRVKRALEAAIALGTLTLVNVPRRSCRSKDCGRKPSE